MAFNPWGNNDDDTSFEQGNPLSQTAKNAAKTTSTQASQQQKAFSKAFNDQLYGPTTDAINQQANNAPQKDLPPGMETIQKQMPQNATDEKQLEEARKKLQEFQKQHREEYYEKTFGDSARKKIEQEEQQKKQSELQEEEEIRQQKEKEKAAQEENLAMAAHGKNTGRNRMQQPVALTQAKTKTEINRGTSG